MSPLSQVFRSIEVSNRKADLFRKEGVTPSLAEKRKPGLALFARRVR
jgi:hypothetical protein